MVGVQVHSETVRGWTYHHGPKTFAGYIIPVNAISKLATGFMYVQNAGQKTIWLENVLSQRRELPTQLWTILEWSRPSLLVSDQLTIK